MTPESPLLTTREACLYMKHCREWLRQHRAELGVIRSSKGKVLYRQAALDCWIEQHETRPVTELAERTSRPRPVNAGNRITPRISRLTGLPRGAYAAQQRGAS